MKHRQSGAIGVEYALVIALVSLLVIAAAVTLGSRAVDYVLGLSLGL